MQLGVKDVALLLNVSEKTLYHREFLLRVLLAREALCSTAVGHGVAIRRVPGRREEILFAVRRVEQEPVPTRGAPEGET